MQECWEKNFAPYELGDLRLNKRAREIGKLLSQGFGKALSESFPEANALFARLQVFANSKTEFGKLIQPQCIHLLVFVF